MKYTLRKFRFWFVFASALATLGCSPVSVWTSVSSFSKIPYSDDKSFFIQASETQSQSLEFENYASSVAKRLTRGLWKRTLDSAEAAYIVSMDYGVSGSREVASSRPVYGQTGGGTTSYSGTVYGSQGSGTYSGTASQSPSFGVVGYATSSSTVHGRYFNLRVFERVSGKPVYKTTASSSGSSATFGQVSECIFDAALGDFPRPRRGSFSQPMSECGEAKKQ